MSEVTATGMQQLYPGVCSECILYPHAHFPDTCEIPAWAETLLVQHQGQSQGLNQRTVEMEAHAFHVL